jgi:hypothetical protein
MTARIPLQRRLPLVVAVCACLGAPAAASDIMTYERYQQIEHEEPYIVRIEVDAGTLLQFGSRHSFDPDDPQMDVLEAEWNAFGADVLLTESHGVDPEGLDRDETIRRFGEVGLAHRLAEAASVPVLSLEPDRLDEIAHLRGTGRWTEEQLKVFYTIRRVTQAVTSGAKIDLEDAATKYMGFLSTERGLAPEPSTIEGLDACVRRLLPDAGRWKDVPSAYFYPGPQPVSRFTNEISTATNVFRDEHHVERILAEMHDGRRVFVVVGSAHAVMQEPALRERLEAPKSDARD